MKISRTFTITRTGRYVLLAMSGTVFCLAGYILYSYLQESDVKSETELLFETNENYEPYADLLGNPVALTDYLDKVIVVHSWASWCPSCVEQIKMFQTSTANNNDQVQIIAINRAESINTIERFKNTFSIEDSVLMVIDPSDRFYNSVGAYAMPETIIYDKAGNKALQVHGEISQEILEQKIAELLEEN